MAEKQFLTKKGYDERVARLEELKVVRRKEVAQKLKEAREQGDLSENAEYDAAKDEQRDIETEIAELEGERSCTSRCRIRRGYRVYNRWFIRGRQP